MNSSGRAVSGPERHGRFVIQRERNSGADLLVLQDAAGLCDRAEGQRHSTLEAGDGCFDDIVCEGREVLTWRMPSEDARAGDTDERGGEEPRYGEGIEPSRQQPCIHAGGNELTGALLQLDELVKALVVGADPRYGPVEEHEREVLLVLR